MFSACSTHNKHFAESETDRWCASLQVSGWIAPEARRAMLAPWCGSLANTELYVTLVGVRNVVDSAVKLLQLLSAHGNVGGWRRSQTP